MYVKDIQQKVVAADTEPEVLSETASTAWVCGNNCLGRWSSHRVMIAATCSVQVPRTCTNTLKRNSWTAPETTKN